MMMKTILLSSFLLAANLYGQATRSKIPAEDRKVTNAQAVEIFDALRAVNGSAKNVVFPIYGGRERVIAYGISIGDGKLLTKASEVIGAVGIYSANQKGVALPVKILGTYPEHDLAVLKVDKLKAPVAKWRDAENLDEGSFLTAIGPGGDVLAMGVLSVRERSLKNEDQGFLGIQMNPETTGDGVQVSSVVKGSAAEAVGILDGDYITKIEGEPVKGFFELSNRLRRLKNGEQPTIELRRGRKTLQVKPILRGRTDKQRKSRRLERMDRMSGSRSEVRAEFSHVIQSDMALEASDVGLPVVDLQGRIVGLVIARAGRISTLILPGDDIVKVLQTEPEPYVQNERVRQRQFDDDRRNRMKMELDIMREMMENLQRELEGQ